MNPYSRLHNLFKKKDKMGYFAAYEIKGDKEFFVVLKDQLIPLFRLIKNNPDFGLDLLLDITCFKNASENLELIYLFISTSFLDQVYFSVILTPGEAHVPTLTELYKSADWLEREIFEQFGIEFEGHYAMKPLFTPPKRASHAATRNTTQLD